jgi:proline iminopeptidase
VPVSIVHGSRDVTCPPEAAWLLHRALPASRLLMLEDAGHLMSEPTMTYALVRETDRMRRQIS